MYEKLIERLREYPDREETAGGYVEVDWQDLLDAADAIESLTAQLAALQSENAKQNNSNEVLRAERDALRDSVTDFIVENADLLKIAIDTQDRHYLEVLIGQWRGAQGEG